MHRCVAQRIAAMVAEQIIAIRKARDWSQKDLADHLGVDQSTVSRWEAGQASVRGPALRLLMVLNEQPTASENAA